MPPSHADANENTLPSLRCSDNKRVAKAMTTSQVHGALYLVC